MIPFAAVRMEGEDKSVQLSSGAKIARSISRQLARMRQQLRMGLPVATKEDVRRYRLYEAGSVLMELLGSGEEWAAQSFCQLLQLDDASRAVVAQDPVATNALRRPRLANSPLLLYALSTGLCKASAASKEGDAGAMGAELLALAESMWARGLAWWWLTEHLLVMAADASKGWTQDGGLSEASAALAYGAFLLYQVHVGEEALPHLNLASQLSTGKPWMVSPALLELLPAQGAWSDAAESPEPESAEDAADGPPNGVPLSRVASAVLVEALIQEARRARQDCEREQAAQEEQAAITGQAGQKGDFGKEHAQQAAQLAQTARLPSLERAAQRELGTCLLAGGSAEEAVSAFNVFLVQARMAADTEDVVIAHLKLALCNHRTGNNEGVKHELEEARTQAQEAGLQHLLGVAHLHKGEFFLNTTRPHYATGNFRLSFLRHSELEEVHEADEARVMAGVAAGLELLPEYGRVLSESGRERERLLALIAWKDSHRPFWPDEVRVSRHIRELHRPDQFDTQSLVTLETDAGDDDELEKQRDESEDGHNGEEEFSPSSREDLGGSTDGLRTDDLDVVTD